MASASIRSRPYRIIMVTALAGVLALAGCAADDLPPPAPETLPATDAATPVETAGEPEEPAPIRVAAMGDMLPHDSVHANARVDSGWDYGQFFEGVQEEIDAADAVFCNQEVPSAGEDLGVTGYPVFNAPREFAVDLRERVGCDLVNLANNHTADKGANGIRLTREVWDELDPVSISGANRSAEEQGTVVYGDVRGVRVALLSFAEYSNAPIDAVSLNLMGNTALVEALMAEARTNADIVLVSAHWGTEDSHQVNGAQRAFAQRVADLGADVVLGTGPHVLQPVEWLDRAGGGRTLVWYSLGNMLSTQLGIDQLTGVIASFEIVPGDGDVPATVERPAGLLTYMHYDWSAEERAAGDLLARHNLSITALADSDELLARTAFGVTAEDQFARSAEILGPEVELR